METGDRIIYTYQHSLNRKSKIWISKKGVFIRNVKNAAQHGNTFTSKAVVKLDGNKNNSVVPIGSFTIDEA